MSAKPRVLVVDDEPAILRFLKPALEANDYEVSHSATVATRSSALPRTPPTSFCSISASPTATARR